MIGRSIYALLLRLHPRAFRRRFGARMLDDFECMRAEARRPDARFGTVRLWWRIVADTLASAMRARRPTPLAGSAPRDVVSRRRSFMDTIRLDVRLTARALAHRPGFSVLAIATLALAIGANTTLFSVLNGVLLKPLPYPDAERLAILSESAESFNNVSYPNFRDWRAEADSFEDMGAMTWGSASLTGGSEPLRITVGNADPAFMRAAGLRPVLGRTFRPDDDRPDAAAVAILSHALWQQSFGADPAIVNGTVRLNGVAVEVVGVLGPGADFAEAGTHLWRPLVPAIGDWVSRREVHSLTVLARLSPAATLESARSELDGLAASLAQAYPESNAGRGAVVTPLHDVLVGNVSASLWLLMGMVALVLLIACANVASLLLARLASRQPELAIRRALGAGRADLVRLFLTESLLITLAGGLLGVVLAYSALGAVVGLLGDRLPRLTDVGVDTTVLAFAVAVSVAIGVVFGLLPGLGRRHREGGLDASGRGQVGPGRSAALARSVLSAGQVAGAVTLLVATGLLLRSFQGLQSVDIGFEPDRLATLSVSLAGTGRSTEDVIQFYRDLPALIQAVPGVRAAAAVNALPISGGDSTGDVTIEGRPFAPGEAPGASFRRITPGYFETLGARVLFGRDFASSDDGVPMVTIINASMARALWDSPADAIGARIKVGPPDAEPWLTVVGVVGDISNVGVSTEPRFATYEPHPQRPWSTMSLVYRTDGDPTLVAADVQRRVRDAGGAIPVYGFSTLTERIADSLRPRRIALLLTAAFALLTMLTASIGVYGVLSYNVSRRARELGLRLALGAGRARIMREVGAEAARIIGAGVLVGLAAAAALAGLLDSVLYGVSPRDPATFVVVPVTLALVGAVACYRPARRAASIDPVSSLRQE